MELLRIYLQDHLATCTGMVELAKRAHAANRTSDAFGPPLAALRDELADDRETLRQVAARLGVRPDRLKEGATWSAEKVGRLKLNGRVRGYSPLSRVVELEGLSMLLQGKRRLWETLASLAGGTRLASVDTEAMLARVDGQLARATELHAQAVALAFPAGASA